MLSEIERIGLQKLYEILQAGGQFEDEVETITDTQEIYHFDHGLGRMNDQPSKRIVTKRERRLVSKRAINDSILKYILQMQEIDYAMAALKREGYIAALDPENKQAVQRLKKQLERILGNETTKETKNSRSNQRTDTIKSLANELLGVRKQ